MKLLEGILHYRKFEFKIPVFFGCLGSLVFCALLAIRWPDSVPGVEVGEHDSTFDELQDIVFEAAEESPTAAGNIHFFARPKQQRHDPILELYRQPETQGHVIDFFGEICSSAEVAEVILSNADTFDVAPALAFALGWEESRLNPLAVNDRNRDESIDRGLFQLNNRSFPRLEVQAFFDLELNAYYGMSHLRYCLDTGGTEIAALAMYNAGTFRVRNSGTPKTTLDYVSRILENRKEIESRFADWEFDIQPQFDDFPEIAEAEPEPERSPRPFLLMPLGIR